jgi:CBS domain-containing protein
VWLVLGYLAGINALVLAFNLVPAFPLDGGRILRSALWAGMGNLRRATHWASLLGQSFGYLLIIWGVLSFFSNNWLNGIWLGLIGLFINNAARGTYQQVLFQQVLRGEPVGRFMNRAPVVVPPSLDLRHWVEDFVYQHHRKAFPVASNGHVEGLITTQALTRFPRETWGQHTVGEAMVRDLAPVTVSPATDSLEALRRMRQTGSSRLLVTEGGRLVGIVSLKDLLRFLQLKLDLEGPGDERQEVREGNGRQVPV